MVEAVVGVGESSNLAFWDTLLGTVGLADLGMDQMVLFFFCEFSEGWVC